MSRSLPEKPSLEFLKKEAKELRRGMPQAKLADAQHALANEYGFATWAKLKAHVEALSLTPALALTAAVRASDAARVRELLDAHPELRARIDAPLEDYDHGTARALRRRTAHRPRHHRRPAGRRSRYPQAHRMGARRIRPARRLRPEPGRFPHRTRRRTRRPFRRSSGHARKLREFVAADPAVVHAPGADGRTPLHFASTVEIAEFLLANGAEIDARDGNFHSTPAQHMLRVEHWRHYPSDRQPIARFLVSRGCQTDILMAAALGDLPWCGDSSMPTRPASPHASPNGTVYTSLLGPHRTAHQVARDFKHEDVYQLLLERTPSSLKLSMACDLGDEAAFNELLAARPDLAATLTDEERRKLPEAAQSGNTKAVRLMLEAGWPVDTAGDMGATALHWAGFNGNAGMAREILRFHPALELKSKEYAGTPLAWAIFGVG